MIRQGGAIVAIMIIARHGLWFRREYADGACAGRGVYGDRCSSCHGNRGQGGVGPSLADVRDVARVRRPTGMDRVGERKMEGRARPDYGANDTPVTKVMPGHAETPHSRRDRAVAAFERVEYGDGDPVRRARGVRTLRETDRALGECDRRRVAPTTLPEYGVIDGGWTMSGFASTAGLASAARITFTAAVVIFIYTIVIGILNGMDLWEPEHDLLMSHVHSGTLGWITLGVAGIAVLDVLRRPRGTVRRAPRVTTMAVGLVAAVVLYVVAFAMGDSIFDDRIQRPIFGTVLFVVVIWVLVWFVAAYRAYPTSSAARLGLLLAWISLLIGSLFGIILGLFTANGEVPGLDNETAARFADAHPPAMVIGYLPGRRVRGRRVDAARRRRGRGGSVQMWLLFVAGLIINIAFVTGKDEELAGPANLLMIAAGLMLLWRSRSMLPQTAGAGSVSVCSRASPCCSSSSISPCSPSSCRGSSVTWSTSTHSPNRRKGCSSRSTTRCSSG